MFGLFKKKSEKEVLNAKYKKLLEEGYQLSTSNRTKSDAKYAEFDVNVDTDVINLVPPTSTVIRSDAPNDLFCLLAGGSSLLVDMIIIRVDIMFNLSKLLHVKSESK